jgi:hypothetical protein
MAEFSLDETITTDEVANVFGGSEDEYQLVLTHLANVACLLHKHEMFISELGVATVRLERLPNAVRVTVELRDPYFLYDVFAIVRGQIHTYIPSLTGLLDKCLRSAFDANK